MQPRMSDIVKMWTEHRSDPSGKYPELAKIADDNGDGVPEVNRPEEIDALIHSVTQALSAAKYPLENKRVVWVVDDRVYRSGTDYRVVPKREWETSPYANVHKYSHDVFPARAALGSTGCTDCHSPGSDFFFAPALVRLFDETGKPVVEPQYRRLGLSRNTVTLTTWCQAYLKPGLYTLMLVLPCALVALVGNSALRWVFEKQVIPLAIRLIPLAIGVAALAGVVLLLGRPDLLEYMVPSRMWLDANHFLVAVGAMLAGLVALLWELRQWVAGSRERRSALGGLLALVLALSLAVAVLAGLLIFLKIPALDTATRASYTVFDAAITVLLAAAIVTAVRALALQLRGDARRMPSES